ncbi:hypothetical protein [Finegoldia magna]|uniref:Uncharacterized protein n=1 Tax=Finegoldia magna TaxID=1260 RepID=A0A233VKB5_FINMA|nr:hypothetical protein [Finegoldia magna]OXZ32831.1 hypothetical protein B9N55_04155 [Finegoldia magna]
MKKILFVIMIACLTMVCIIDANVSSAVSSASYYELEKVEKSEYGENFTFERGKSPVHLNYEDVYNDGHSGQLYRRRLITIDVTNNTETWYYSGEISK